MSHSFIIISFQRYPESCELLRVRFINTTPGNHISRWLWYLSQEYYIFLQTITLGEGTKALRVLLSLSPTPWTSSEMRLSSKTSQWLSPCFFPFLPLPTLAIPSLTKKRAHRKALLKPLFPKPISQAAQVLGPALAAIWLIFFFQGCHICSELLPS